MNGAAVLDLNADNSRKNMSKEVEEKFSKPEKQRGAKQLFPSKVHHHLLENVLLPERILQ